MVLSLHETETIFFWMSETQRPGVLHARAGLFQSFEEGRCSQKCLVCMPAAQGSSSDVNVDLRYHMVQASKASHGNHWIFQSRQICITHRFRFFFPTCRRITCYGIRHRTIQMQCSQTISIECCKLVRCFVAPPSHTFYIRVIVRGNNVCLQICDMWHPLGNSGFIMC